MVINCNIQKYYNYTYTSTQIIFIVLFNINK